MTTEKFEICIKYLFTTISCKHCIGVYKNYYSPVDFVTNSSMWPILLRRLIAKYHEDTKHQIGCYNDHITLKFNRYFGSATAEVPVKFQSK